MTKNSDTVKKKEILIMKNSSSKNSFLPVCLAIIPVLAAIVFCLPQFSRTVFGSALNINGFQLAFGFKDVVSVPGKGYVFIAFLLPVLSAALLCAAFFIKAVRKRLKAAYLVTAVFALTCVVLLIVALSTIKDINYYKAVLEVAKNGSFTAWFYIGIALHALTVFGCGIGFFRTKRS